MPRSLDPNSRLTMVLACDVDKPKETQPRIFAKMPNLNQQRKLISVIGILQSGGDVGEQFDAATDAAMMCLTGWENIPLPFTRDNIGEVLCLEELMEVFSFLIGETKAEPDDKKKSESQPLSAAENSANPA